MLFEIKHRWTGAVLFSLECGSMRLCVEAAIKTKANLSAADLRKANLREADLSAANLREADLREADLREADLSEADLSAADLRKADLRKADLSAANLREADLREADLTPIRDDLWAVLSCAPAEVASLREALVTGKVNGLRYEGKCACLVGTIANIRHVDVHSIPRLRPNSSRPAERWFLNIRPGDTPKNSSVAKLTVEWIDEWVSEIKKVFAVA